MILLTLFFLVLLLIFPKFVSDAVADTLFICLKDIIPTLFPFSVISGLLVRLSGNISFPPLLLSARLFNISEKSVWALISGLLCGYPIGGRLALMLYEAGEITEAEKDRLLIFANLPGPGFIIGLVGASLLGNIKAGAVIYLSLVAVSLIFGLATRKKSKATKIIPVHKKEKKPFLLLLLKSITEATQSVITICGVICFFSAVTEALRLLPLSVLPFYDFLLGMLEITGGVYSVCAFPISLKLKASLCAFLTGFSGICVLMQLKSVSDKIKSAAYILNKLLFGALCALITFILM